MPYRIFRSTDWATGGARATAAPADTGTVHAAQVTADAAKQPTPPVILPGPIHRVIAGELGTITEVRRTTEHLVAWHDHRIAGELTTLIDTNPPRALQATAGLWDTTRLRTRRPAAELYWRPRREEESGKVGVDPASATTLRSADRRPEPGVRGRRRRFRLSSKNSRPPRRPAGHNDSPPVLPRDTPIAAVERGAQREEATSASAFVSPSGEPRVPDRVARSVTTTPLPNQLVERHEEVDPAPSPLPSSSPSPTAGTVWTPGTRQPLMRWARTALAPRLRRHRKTGPAQPSEGRQLSPTPQPEPISESTAVEPSAVVGKPTFPDAAPSTSGLTLSRAASTAAHPPGSPARDAASAPAAVRTEEPSRARVEEPVAGTAAADLAAAAHTPGPTEASASAALRRVTASARPTPRAPQRAASPNLPGTPPSSTGEGHVEQAHAWGQHVAASTGPVAEPNAASSQQPRPTAPGPISPEAASARGHAAPPARLDTVKRPDQASEQTTSASASKPVRAQQHLARTARTALSTGVRNDHEQAPTVSKRIPAGPPRTTKSTDDTREALASTPMTPYPQGSTPSDSATPVEPRGVPATGTAGAHPTSPSAPSTDVSQDVAEPCNTTPPASTPVDQHPLHAPATRGESRAAAPRLDDQQPRASANVAAPTAPDEQAVDSQAAAMGAPSHVPATTDPAPGGVNHSPEQAWHTAASGEESSTTVAADPAPAAGRHVPLHTDQPAHPTPEQLPLMQRSGPRSGVPRTKHPGTHNSRSAVPDGTKARPAQDAAASHDRGPRPAEQAQVRAEQHPGTPRNLPTPDNVSVTGPHLSGTSEPVTGATEIVIDRPSPAAQPPRAKNPNAALTRAASAADETAIPGRLSKAPRAGQAAPPQTPELADNAARRLPLAKKSGRPDWHSETTRTAPDADSVPDGQQDNPVSTDNTTAAPEHHGVPAVHGRASQGRAQDAPGQQTRPSQARRDPDGTHTDPQLAPGGRHDCSAPSGTAVRAPQARPSSTDTPEARGSEADHGTHLHPGTDRAQAAVFPRATGIPHHVNGDSTQPTAPTPPYASGAGAHTAVPLHVHSPASCGPGGLPLAPSSGANAGRATRGRAPADARTTPALGPHTEGRPPSASGLVEAGPSGSSQALATPRADSIAHVPSPQERTGPGHRHTPEAHQVGQDVLSATTKAGLDPRATDGTGDITPDRRLSAGSQDTPPQTHSAQPTRGSEAGLSRASKPPATVEPGPTDSPHAARQPRSTAHGEVRGPAEQNVRPLTSAPAAPLHSWPVVRPAYAEAPWQEPVPLRSATPGNVSAWDPVPTKTRSQRAGPAAAEAATDLPGKGVAASASPPAPSMPRPGEHVPSGNAISAPKSWQPSTPSLLLPTTAPRHIAPLHTDPHTNRRPDTKTTTSTTRTTVQHGGAARLSMPNALPCAWALMPFAPPQPGTVPGDQGNRRPEREGAGERQPASQWAPAQGRQNQGAATGHPVFRQIGAHAPEPRGRATGVSSTLASEPTASTGAPTTLPGWGIPPGILQAECKAPHTDTGLEGR